MPTEEPSHETFRRNSYFRSLDGLRFFSIVPVIWHHSTERPLLGILGKGPLGVDLFFAISGFLITTLLLREHADRGRISIGRFYARRALRIFPLYYGVLGLYVVRALFFLQDGPMRAHFFGSLPYYATYTSNWFVDFDVPHPVIFAFAWSLATEEQFYVVWPWVVGLGRSWVLPVIVAIALLALDQSVEWGFFLQALPPAGLARRMIRSIASPICMGALLACALHHARSFAIARPILGGRLASPVIFAVLVATVASDAAPLSMVQLFMMLLVGACSVRSDHGLAVLTDGAIVRRIGSVSYAMYLFHVAVITGVRKALLHDHRVLSSDAFVFALAFVITVGLALTSERWLERPLAARRARLRSTPSP